MKYIFKNQYGYNVNKMGKPIQYLIGGTFINEKYPEKTNINLTPYNVIYDSRDMQLDCLNYLSTFFGGKQLLRNELDGLIGNWDQNIKNNANIYYLIDEENNDIIEILFTKFLSPTLTDISGIQYIINKNGKMFDAIPEEGDILFDNYKEAKKYLKNKENGKI